MHGYRHQTMQPVSITTLHAQCTIHTCATASLLTSPWDNHHGWLGIKTPKLFKLICKLISWNHGFLAQPQTDCCDFNNSSLKSAHCLGLAPSYLTRQADYSCNQSHHLCSHALDAWCSHWKRVGLIFTGHICTDAGDGGRWGGWKGEGGRKEDQSVWRWRLHWPLCCPSVTATLPAPSASLPLPGHKNRVCVVSTLLKLQSHTFYNNNKIYTYKYITSFI